MGPSLKVAKLQTTSWVAFLSTLHSISILYSKYNRAIKVPLSIRLIIIRYFRKRITLISYLLLEKIAFNMKSMRFNL